MTDLLPCPFCGSTDSDTLYDYDRVFVECDDCGAHGPTFVWGLRFADPEKDQSVATSKAAEAWNRRATLHVRFTRSETVFERRDP